MLGSDSGQTALKKKSVIKEFVGKTFSQVFHYAAIPSQPSAELKVRSILLLAKNKQTAGL